MEVNTAIIQRRTIRLFQDRAVPKEVLMELAELARFYPSGGNRQPIRYAIVTREETRAQVFSCLRWAAYLPDFQIPPHQRPQAYIVLLADCVGCDQDVGAAAASLLLAARSAGLDGCWLGSVDRDAVRKILDVDPGYQIAAVLALGYAAQESVSEDMEDDHKYYLDEKNVLHVPKRKKEELLLYCDI